MSEKKTVINTAIHCGRGDFLFDEAFNSLAVNLKYIAKQDQCAVVAVTSHFSGEGKSTVSYNLSFTLAQQGRRVLLIDADLRRGRLHRYFDEERSNGLTDYLCGIKKSKEIVRKSNVEGFDYVSAGATTMSPIKLLDRKEFALFIDEMRKNYDWIIIDSAPVGMVSDALMVMRIVDGAILVADQKKSRKNDVARAVESLKVSKVDILGFVLNNAENIRNAKGRGRYSRYERYGYYLTNRDHMKAIEKAKAQETQADKENKEG